MEKNELDIETEKLSTKYLPLAIEILKEAIRIPEDYLETDSQCGLSNHEGPRMEFFKKTIIEQKCVEKPEDVWFDAYGNIGWMVQDCDDGIDPDKKKIVYFDGHCDTVKALRPLWKKLGGGVDPYKGLIDSEKVDLEKIKENLGYIPPKSEWENLVFGRGSADQLAGVVSQMIATKIMLELKKLGSLKGVIIRSFGTACEEDNDGGGPMYIIRNELSGKSPQYIPDCCIFTEGTGDSTRSALGIYIGQRGRLINEIEIIGKSAHGSMPHLGKNPIEYGSLIIKEAAERAVKMEGFLDHEFLGRGTRTCSWAFLDTPSDCAVPERFVFRFDRRITIGETPKQTIDDLESFESVKKARDDGLTVNIRIPQYTETTWKGYKCNNEQIYMSWITPKTHPAIQSAVETYKSIVTPFLPKDQVETTTNIHKEPRVDRWIFSTDGVGYPVPKDYEKFTVPESKNWCSNEDYKWPAMFGIGAGFEQNTHKIGEYVDSRELKHAISFLARFPNVFAQEKK
ncbi:peptidase m20 domain-containing protein [Anaeramoeba ignava]|uniref:Peptidase m20 domain-containing protein n=1 Tax=Anaeramoeba ignava TaxID=1746090 RepID=A0A9Q0LTI0_ANAIG|nr:peptidase m20 domain-containing protein [Anaeramoeba ignava]